MTRGISAVGGADLAPALRAALDGTGPAVFAGPDGPLPALVPRRIALVVQSSGSTGRPKRVALSSDALLASAAASESALGGPGQWLLALPTTYIAGINVLVRSYAAQTTPVTVPPGSFTARTFVDAAAALDPEQRWFASLVPTQLQLLVDEPSAVAVLRRLDRVLVGGQATPTALLERALDLGVRVTRTYGSSETSGGCIYDGMPIGSVHARVVDGEVQLAGPVLAEGYLDDPELTERAFVTDAGARWYRTSDAGSVAADGRVTVTGRLDDVLISGGLKVSLGALEALVREYLPDAVVVAVDHDRWGQVPVVVATRDMDLAVLRALAVDRLGRAAAPDRLVVVESIPTLASGKPDRLRIRRELPG
jgi:O-succinylbenzoic acid--CoA ligase